MGGQIAREIITWLSPRSGIKISLILSMAICLVLLGLGIKYQYIFVALYMTQFLFMNYQEYNALSGGRRF